MNIFKEIPPTAGYPLHLKDIFSALFRINQKEALEKKFKSYLNAPYARVTYSGTAAFYFILETLKELFDKKTVIIPAFICPLVPLAINKAGLKIKVCDTKKDSFDYDYGQLASLCKNDPNILAVVAAHLGGISVDLDRINKIARENNIFIIEDCAQSLGAEYKNRKIGTYGDFAFFSLCRGKGLTIYEGGVALTSNEEYAVVLDNTINRLENRAPLAEAIKVFELIGYWIFYRPLLFWFVFRLPQLYWRIKKELVRAAGDYFDTDFPMHRVSAFRKSIGATTFDRLEKEITKQRDKATQYLSKLRKSPGVKIISEQTDTKATYPFITVLFDNPEKRQQVLMKLEKTGIGASIIYLKAVTDYEYLKNIIPNTSCPNAQSLSSRHLTLSTSTFLDKKIIKTIAI